MQPNTRPRRSPVRHWLATALLACFTLACGDDPAPQKGGAPPVVDTQPAPPAPPAPSGPALRAAPGEEVPRLPDADSYLRSMALTKTELPQTQSERTGDPEYMRELEAQRKSVYRRLESLIQGLYELDPSHGHMKILLPERWQAMCREFDETDRAVTEIEAVLRRTDLDPALAHEMRYSLAMAHVAKLNDDLNAGLELDVARADRASAAISTYLELSPAYNPMRDPSLLYDFARAVEADPERQRWAYSELAARFPESRLAATARGLLRREERIGQPFEFTFEDAITHEPFDIQSLRGKVVVISFWATTHPRCLVELEEHKELLLRYAGKLAFVGVSLDDHESRGGRDALKGVVAGQGVTWPQYYDGLQFRGELVTEWGITKIPTLFVIDAQGRLRSTDAHGRLEQAIEEALAAGG